MSLAKLIRKNKRARIHDRNVALAQKLAEQKRSEWERAGEVRGYRKHQEETTRILGIPSRRNGAATDAFLLGEQPKDRVTLVALYSRLSMGFDEYRDNAHRFEGRPHMARFEPVRKAWTSAEGQLVVWFDYEFRGMS